MDLIDRNELLEQLKNLEASGGSKMYCKALNDALHDFFPKIINELPTITQLPNDPLTLDELCEMDGEPVWLQYDRCWVFVLVIDGIPMLANLDGERCKAEAWMSLWGNIYRYKLEEQWCG